ncbi:MAG: nucleoside kinase, partial [Oscillospiraceae bacterium]|nr:nucleoside kinase [Oscillospiraceae bacterium]
INCSILKNSENFILESEKYFYACLEQLCDFIKERRATHPVVLISGPSGSGKTSTAHKISEIMKSKYNKNCAIISLDNYFRSNSSPDMPKNHKGNIDLESPLCTDLELLRQHLILIKQKKEFLMPVFDFQAQARSHYIPFVREKGSVVIMEGIHALNPIVTGNTKEFATCVYISVDTQIQSFDGSLLNPEIIRLLRRLCRDSLFRGRKTEDIFQYFDDLSIGEEKYIFPFKHRADFNINTFMPYEVSIYKKLLELKLKLCSDSFTENKRFQTIMKFFNELYPLNADMVPKSSTLREFIGNKI